MKVKNLTVKPIGFGSTIILPDDVGTLPQDYGKDHPTVKYYFSRKWIEEVGGTSGSTETPSGGVSVDVGINDGTDGEKVNAPASKPIDRMNKEELQALAFERGVEFTEADTKAMLIDKIRAAGSAEQ